MEVVGKNHWTMMSFEKDQGFFSAVVVACCEDGCFIAVGLSVDVRELVIEEDADGCLA